jgi:transmembrane sensor
MVAHDSHRPFRMRTRAGVVQAIGTQFNVYARQSGETRVSVIEGRVQLTAMATGRGSAPQALILEAGEVADIGLDGTIQRNAKVSVGSAVAWRGRRLIFSDVLLEEMVMEFNRYNRSPRLRLQDVPTGTYRFAIGSGRRAARLRRF